MAKEYSEEIVALLKQVVDHFDDEDRGVRESQIRIRRKLKLFWENFQNTNYNEVAHDWRVPTNVGTGDTDQAYYDKQINIFRAYLESIIAALSVTVPGIKCFPDDAENPLDLSTARAGDQAAKQIYQHNEVMLVWLHALFVYCTEGMVAGYNYLKSDKKFGTYEDKSYRDVEEHHEVTTCPSCGFELEDSIVDSPEIVPGIGQEDISGVMDTQDICPSCGMIMSPEVSRRTEQIRELFKTEDKAKSRVCLEAYGSLNIKVPLYARKQSECLYLSYSYETHFANIIEEYPHLRDIINRPSGPYDPYEAWGRLSPQYGGDYPISNRTVRQFWLRPAAFNILTDEEYDLLKKEFPDGAKVVLINDEFAEAIPEDLDDAWTLSYNPLSDYLQFDPLGLLLVSIQEITNDIVSLTLQTVEHGIGQTFADPSVLNFDAYRNMETVPGGIYPAKAKAGKSLQEGFLELKTANLSQEVGPFGESIQSMGQMVSGALPSLFGGAMAEQKTASGYAMSRAQALQRLQNVWKMFTTWWKQIFGKAIPMYIGVIEEDERDVQLTSNGNFINVFIRRADLEGKIGKFELESNENLPITWSQRKDTVMQLFQTNNEMILAQLAAPENLPLIREALGLDNFIITGEDDRNKQYDEINLLLNSAPMTVPGGMDAMGQPTEQEFPSVDVDPEIDNHQIEFEICRNWLVGDAGRLTKVSNPNGYKNVLLHAKMHLMFMQQAMMAAQGNGANPEKPNENDKNAPIEGEADVKSEK